MQQYLDKLSFSARGSRGEAARLCLLRLSCVRLDVRVPERQSRARLQSTGRSLRMSF